MSEELPTFDWTPLGDPAPAVLAEPRSQLHWASQIVAAAGTTLAEPAPDSSHTNLGWDEELGALVGRAVGDGLRVAIRPGDFALLLLDGNREIDVTPCAGLTVDGALAWLAAALRPRVEGGGELALPAHDMPDHPLAAGAVFAYGSPAGFSEVGRWFANAHRALAAVADAEGGIEPRCWPHHFDIATLINLDPDVPAEDARSIGVGMTPGDGSYGEPYFYVTPWPYPREPELPELAAAGVWHTAGWTGAVLTGSTLVASPPGGQPERTRAFLASAIAACGALL